MMTTRKTTRLIMAFLISIISITLMLQTSNAALTHEAFTILSPVENETYTVNEVLDISVKADKFYEMYVNGFLASSTHYVILEISKDEIVKDTAVLSYGQTSDIFSYGVGETMKYGRFVPRETGTYTIRVGFCKYDRGDESIGNTSKVTEANYVGTYQFNVAEAPPETEKPADDSGSGSDSSVTPEASQEVTSSESTYEVGAFSYTVSNNTATIAAPKSKTVTKVTIPATVKINGKSVPVTSIAANAFKGMKNLTTVTIGKNVKKIGKNAFYGCKKLKKITIKTTKLTAKSVGAGAFKGINKKAVFKLPKAKKAAYKKILLKKGAKKTMAFK